MKKYSYGLLVALALLSAIAVAAEQTPPRQPNFVIITLDDLQWQTFGHLDSNYSSYTPFLTELANESTTFLHSYVPYSLCTPARASLMTGLDPHRHGVVAHYQSIFTGVRTLPEAMRSAGYYTGLIGKVRHTLVGRQRSLDFIVGPDQLRLGRSPTHFQAETERFVAAANGRPFIVNINIHDPHTPYPGADKADRWKSYVQYMTDRTGLSSILRSRRLEYQGSPPADSVRYKPSEVPVYPFLPDVPAVREEMAQILTAARRADDSVQAIISALEESGVANETAVFIFSDNGAAVPFSKEGVYLNSMRAGLIARVPWMQTRTDTESLVSINDIYPTILEMANVNYDADSIDGKSLASLLAGDGNDDLPLRQYLTGYFFGGFAQRSITDGSLWYIWNPWADGQTQARGHFASSRTFAAMKQADDERFRFLVYRAPEELYDVDRDPNSRSNLVGAAEYDETLAQMRLALHAHMEKTLDPMLDEFRAFLRSR